jgi:hypothetical protein
MNPLATLVYALGATALVAACGARTPLDLGASASGVSTAPEPVPRYGVVGARATASGAAYAFGDFLPAGSTDLACDYFGANGQCFSAPCLDDVANSPDVGQISVWDSTTNTVASLELGFGSYAQAFPWGTPTQPGDVIDFEDFDQAAPLQFDTQATVPAFVDLTSPVLAAGAAIDTTRDLALTWTPTSGGDTTFRLAATLPLPQAPTIICFFDGASGTGTVPQAALASVKAMSLDGNATATFQALARQQTTEDGWIINTVALVGGKTSDQTTNVMLE